MKTTIITVYTHMKNAQVSKVKDKSWSRLDMFDILGRNFDIYKYSTKNRTYTQRNSAKPN